MAERKTFLFFCGWAESLADFSPEERCAIYDAIIAYAEDGTLPSLTPVAQVAFKFIKKDIDEMQVKYNAICEKRRESVRKRWEIQKNTSDTNECKCIQKNTSDTNGYIHKHEHNHEHKHEHEQEAIDKSIPSAANIPRTGAGGAAAPELRAKIAELKKGEIWLTQVAMKFHVTTDEVCRQLDEFCDEMELRGRQVNSPQGLFVTWLGDRKYGSKPRSPSQTEPGLGIGEFRNGKGQRTYGTGGVIVPESAPPRPSEAHWWSDSSKLWEKTI